MLWKCMCDDTLTGPPCIAMTMLKCVYVCVCIMYVSVSLYVCMYPDQIRICNASVEKVIYKNSVSERFSLK